jgi:hypothetical protein
LRVGILAAFLAGVAMLSVSVLAGEQPVAAEAPMERAKRLAVSADTKERDEALRIFASLVRMQSAEGEEAIVRYKNLFRGGPFPGQVRPQDVPDRPSWRQRTVGRPAR